jgi:hypothetical protein
MDGLLFDVSQYETKPPAITSYNCESDPAAVALEMLLEIKRRKNALAQIAPKKSKRPDGTGYLFEKVYKKNNKEYYQLWFQWEKNGKRFTKYVRQHLEEKVRMMRHNGATVEQILEALAPPRS